jgi:hypothetical protein
MLYEIRESSMVRVDRDGELALWVLLFALCPLCGRSFDRWTVS